MALTKEDLQAIRLIVQEEVQSETARSIVREEVRSETASIKEDIAAIKERVEYIAVVLEGTIKLVDDIDQKQRAM